MKHRSFFLLNFRWAFIAALGLGVILATGCNKDDDDIPQVDTPIASFQFEVSQDNFLEVAFTNFSQNASTYQWDFGDGNTSTEKDPTHVYDKAGTYTVVLTAFNSEGESAKRNETITLNDPDQQLTLLAGAESKTWYLMREGIALGIGPAAGDNQWWSFGGVTPLADRPCILDDAYTFTRDGAFEFNSAGTIFIDSEGNGGWHPTEGCWEETNPDVWGDNPARSAFGNGGDYTYDFDDANQTLTINGEGAYIGLANKTNTGDNPNPEMVKSYVIVNLASGDIADTLQLALPINNGDGGYWNYNLVSYKNIADLPDIPSAVPNASFNFEKDGLTVTFTNTSSNSTSYSWDFGDGGMSTEVNPTHTYAAEGAYTVTLSAMDDDGNMDQIAKEVVVSSAAFTPDVLSSADGKAWVLDGAQSYFVGPAAGSGEWWPGITEDDVEVRACQMDDEYIFFDDGTYEYATQGDVWAEDFMGGSFACIAESELMDPYDALASGTYTYEVTEAMGDERAKITVIGEGAFIGFAKGFNGGELNPANGVGPASQITYEVLEYSAAGGVEVLTVAVDISADQSGTAWWTMRIRTAN